MQINDLQHIIALSLLPRVGSVLAKTLLQVFGDAPAIFNANKAALMKVDGIGEDTAQQILQGAENALRKADSELEFIDKYQIQPLFYTEPYYPQRLRNFEDAPILLYYRGNADLNAQRVVAIVGTRRPTDRGKAFCEELVRDLHDYNVLVTSGLALGIDITAHRKCVELGVPNIGVVAHGLDAIYPPAHRNTAQSMVANGGILTEFVSQTAPLQQNFPMRNRIIAGMADAVVVVESGQTGGSMITAYFANEYQKDVFAVPGRTEDELSVGCNYLIKSHRAALLQSAEDIAYIMRWKRGENSPKKAAAKAIFVELNDEEQQLMALIQPHEKGVHLDHLIQASQIGTSRIAVVLLELELKGLLRSLPGKRFAAV